MYAFHVLLSRPWSYDNNVIYDGHVNSYSLNHNGCSLTLTPLLLPKPHKIRSRKGSEKNIYKSETQDECATSKSKPQIALLVVKPIISDEVNPLCPVTPIPYHASGDELINKLTIGKSLPSKPSLGLESCDLVNHWVWILLSLMDSTCHVMKTSRPLISS